MYVYTYIHIHINFPNATQELEIEAFTCTVLQCIKKKKKKKKEKSSSAETSKGFYYCPTPLIAQLTLVQASTSLTIEMAYGHSARYMCITVTVCWMCQKKRDRMRKSDR